MKRILVFIFLLSLPVLAMQPVAKPQKAEAPKSPPEVMATFPFVDVTDDLINFQVQLGPWGPSTEFVMAHKQGHDYFQKQLNELNCDSKDLRPNFKSPPRDQQGFYWCYAYSMADYVSYITGEDASALDVALTMFEREKLKGTFNQSLSELGSYFPNDVLKEVLKQGLCREEDMASNNVSIKGHWLDVDDEKPSSKKQSVPKEINELTDTSAMKIIEGIHNQFNEEEGDGLPIQFCGQEFAMLKRIFPNLLFEDVVNAFAYYDKDELWSGLKQANCTKKIKPTQNYEIVYQTKQGNFQTIELLKAINSQLDNTVGPNKGLPAIIHYASDLPKERTEATIDPKRFNHASLVVGRRKNPENGQCEYLIRNTWGGDNKDNNEEKSIVKKEDGYFWTSANSLAAHLYSVTYAKSKD